MEEGIGGAVLADAVSSHVNKLHDVDAVRPAYGAPGKPTRRDNQRLRYCHRACLRHHLLGLLRRQEEAGESASGVAS